MDESRLSHMMLGPSSADATGKDFTDARGRRWISQGKVVPKDFDVAASEKERRNADGYSQAGRCNGIQSTQWVTTNPARAWNEVRRWDATTYNFFDAYGNWPRL